MIVLIYTSKWIKRCDLKDTLWKLEKNIYFGRTTISRIERSIYYFFSFPFLSSISKFIDFARCDKENFNDAGKWKKRKRIEETDSNIGERFVRKLFVLFPLEEHEISVITRLRVIKSSIQR